MKQQGTELGKEQIAFEKRYGLNIQLTLYCVLFSKIR